MTQADSVSWRRGGLEAPANVMKDFTKNFYGTAVWKSCRAEYLKRKKGLCEECLKHGRYTPANTVHHIIPLTPQNISDQSVTLSFDNLYAVCRDCHAAIHAGHEIRYKVDATGRVQTIC